MTRQKKFPLQICEFYYIKHTNLVTVTSAARFTKYCALTIISRITRFIYYLNIKLAGILQFVVFILYKAYYEKYTIKCKMYYFM